MNDVQKKNSFKWIEPTRSWAGRAAGVGVRITVSTESKGGPRLGVTIYADTMKKMRWVVGDRVLLGFDPEQECIALRRVPSGGYAIGAQFTAKGDRLKAVGTAVNSVVKMGAPPDFVNFFHGKIDVATDDCVEVDGMLLLSISNSGAEQ